MDANQSNDNELQKAIDDITKNNAAPTTDAGAVAAELENKIQDQMGTPPTPPMPPVGSTPEDSADNFVLPTPEAAPEAAASTATSETASAAPEAATEPAAPEATPAVEQPAETPAIMTSAGATVGEESANVEVGNADLEEVKKAMLTDLYPLMDKINIPPEQKYKVYKQMIESTGDKSMISGAYEAVKGIADETTKAEALLYLVEAADN